VIDSVTVLQKARQIGGKTYGAKLAAIWRGRHGENISTPTERMAATLRENVNVWDTESESQRFVLVRFSHVTRLGDIITRGTQTLYTTDSF
jgi:hypothetical protein